MSPRIIQLDESVINQIAAGEVVENAASIVKELIENSLDAKSTEIYVTISGGGQDLILVEDNGIGMSKEDALLSFQRHATSKIRKVEDLFSLSSMGFRGEALAAISSVSHFEMKTSDGEGATEIIGKGGEIEKVTPTVRNQGTSIQISHLFYNTPARKKFQKTKSFSQSQVTKTIEILASAHPEISFQLWVDKKKILSFTKEKREDRIESVFGKLPLRVRSSGILGFFSSLEDVKSHRRGQILFINDRPCVSPVISRAVERGYGTRIQERTYPSFVLFLEIDPSLVDVNVHPQKREVRLSRENELFHKIERAVSQMFEEEAKEKMSSFSSSLQFDRVEPFSFVKESTSPARSVQEVLPWEMKERPLTLMGSFLLFEKEGLFLLDIAKAHARVLFERMEGKKEETEPLLTPIQVETKDPKSIDRLQEFGMECRWIGVDLLAVDSLPKSMSPTEFSSFFEALRDEKKLSRSLALAISRSQKKYTVEEALDLWRNLQNCKDSLYDPLGRKIWKELKQEDLANWLERG